MKSVRSFIVLSLLLAACGSTTTSNRDAAGDNRNAALDDPYATSMCIGKYPVCRFGDLTQWNENDAYYRKILANGDMVGSDLTSARIDSNEMPKVKVNWSMATLDYARLNVLNLDGSRFANALGRRMTMPRIGPDDGTVNQSGWRSAKGLVASFSDFTGAEFLTTDLSDSAFRGSTLVGSRFEDVNLQGADFTGANLTGVASLRIQGKPALPAAWKLINGRIVGPGANLSVESTVEALRDDTVQYAPKTGATSNFRISQQSTCARYWRDDQFLFPRDENRPNIPNAADLMGTDLSKMDLHDADFSGMNLTGTNFRDSNLTGARFIGANLTGARFDNARFANVDLTGATLQGTVITPANVANLRTLCTYMDSATTNAFRDWMYVADDAVVNVTNLFNAEPVTDQQNIRRGILVGPGTDFSGINVSELNVPSNLTNARLAGAISGAVGDWAIVRPTLRLGQKGLPAGWGVRYGLLIGPGAELAYADLRNLSFDRTDFSGVDLRGVRSGQTTISGKTDEKFAVVNGYVLGPNMNLSRASLGTGKVLRATIDGSNIEGADFRGLTLDNVHGVDLTGTAQWPAKWQVGNGILFGPSADLTGVALDLSAKRGNGDVEVDFSKAILGSSRITGFRMGAGTKLPAGYLAVELSIDGTKRKSAIIGPDVAMPEAVYTVPQERDRKAVKLPPGYGWVGNALFGPGQKDRTAASVTGTVSGIDFTGSDIRNVDFNGATLRNIGGAGVNIGRLPKGWGVVGKDSILVGPAAKIDGADLSRTDLSGLDLAGATMTAAHGRFITTSSTTRLPRGWRVLNNFLVGTGADLSSAVISGADFANVNLKGASFTGARITDSKGLSGAGLNGSDVIGGNITVGAATGTGSNVVCSKLTLKDAKSIPKGVVVNETVNPNQFVQGSKYQEPANLCGM